MRSPEGSIKRHADGKRWLVRVRFTKGGTRVSRSQICPSHSLARATLASILAEIDVPKSNHTYRELDAFYRKEYVHPAKFVGGKMVSGFRQDVRTVERYLDRALEVFKQRVLLEISYNDLREYKRLVENLPVRGGGSRSVSDVNHHLKHVRRMLNVAVEQGWLPINPFTRGKNLIVESFEVERTRVITREEELRLIAACNNGYRDHLLPIIIFAIETACRRGEILKLRWQSVDLPGRVIRIEASNTKTLKTRLVPVTERLRQSLARLDRKAFRKMSRVFPIGDFKHSWAGACREAKLDDLHFHDLRHTAITRMLERGISPAIVMKISGHTQQRTFLRYVNQTESSIRDIALALDRAA